MLRYTLTTRLRLGIDNTLAPGNWRNVLNGVRDELLAAYQAWGPSALLSVDSISNSGWDRVSTTNPDRDEASIEASVTWSMDDTVPAVLHASVEAELKPALDAAVKAEYAALVWIVSMSQGWEDSIDIDGAVSNSFHRAKRRRGQAEVNS